MNEYECTISFTYNADKPVEAAQDFVGRLAVSSWFVNVKDIETKEEFIVDSETWEVEES